MITALLLPLLALGGPREAVRSVGGDDPAIQIWISNDRRFLPGDGAKVQVRTREDGYLLVFHTDPDGNLRVLFPLDPGNDDFIRGGTKYEIKGRGGRETFTVGDRRGQGTVYAVVSRDQFRFDEFVLGDHWDYRKLAPGRLSANPEQELNDLVRRMVDNSFDYDILTYDVLEHVVYASEYNSGYYDGCGYSYSCAGSYYGSYGFSVGLFFGWPYYRRPYYDPFFVGVTPYYSPFFYSPYYYHPYYYRPYYAPAYYPGYGYPYYGYYGSPYYYGNHYYVNYGNRYYPGGAGGPFTPYRFRPADGASASYRGRQFVNTVYMPPVVRGRSVSASPVRRVTDTRPAAAPTIDARARVPAGEAGA